MRWNSFIGRVHWLARRGVDGVVVTVFIAEVAAAPTLDTVLVYVMGLDFVAFWRHVMHWVVDIWAHNGWICCGSAWWLNTRWHLRGPQLLMQLLQDSGIILPYLPNGLVKKVEHG